MRPASTQSLVPEQVAATRRVKNISQSTLADSIKKSQAHISNFERGRATLTPHEEKIIRRFLGIGGAK